MAYTLRTTLAASLLCFAGLAHAEIKLENPWVRATVQGKPATGAFMVIKSDKPVQLIGGSASVAEVVEVHEMKMEGDVMKMRAMSALNVPANTPVELKPGSYHIMLMGLKKTLNEGDTVDLALKFKDGANKAETLEIKAPVKPLVQAPMPMNHSH